MSKLTKLGSVARETKNLRRGNRADAGFIHCTALNVTVPGCKIVPGAGATHSACTATCT